MCTSANSRVVRVQWRSENYSHFIYLTLPHTFSKVAVKAFRFRFTQEGEGLNKPAKVVVSTRLAINKS